jgi:hypothetical protein
LAVGGIQSADAFGIGIMGPDPTALTLRPSPRVVLDIGWYFGIYEPFYGESPQSALMFIADYYMSNPTVGSGGLSFYAGLGVRIDMITDPAAVGAGFRIPLGFLLEIPLQAAALEFFLEFPPTIGLLPGVGIGIDPAVGFRINI